MAIARASPSRARRDVERSSARTSSNDSHNSRVVQGKMTHVDASGACAMVNVRSKPSTTRVAIASARVFLGSDAFDAVKTNAIAKGDVLQCARIAGITASKKAYELIPLCHAVAIDFVGVDFALDDDDRAIDVKATVMCDGKTGVEMEALVAATTSALTIYDMCKAVDKGIVIGDVRLEEKSGGKSGHWTRDGAHGAR